MTLTVFIVGVNLIDLIKEVRLAVRHWRRTNNDDL
jgi:hypothetical protein